ncbi:MAG: cupin domain-containing protein [Candidatus Levybacteria bacterium]|nr:cupin domain-containing protein [Candidatus Levybacteria bacterium]
MRIIKKEDALSVSKPEVTNVAYYLFDEYELHYNEQLPNSSQVWHHHEKIWETLFIIEGELTAKWRENGQEKEQIVKAGDVIEVEHFPHTFVNHTNRYVKFLVVKQIISGENKREVFKNDKILDE